MSKQIEKDAVCTIASKNYLAQTMVMAKSIWECNMKRKVYILIADNVDDEIKLEDMEFNKNITLVSLKELHIENVNKMAFYYNLVEFNTAVKPFFMKYLLGKRFIASVTLKKYRFPERYFPLITSCTYQAIHLTMATVSHRIHSLFRPYA